MLASNGSFRAILGNVKLDVSIVSPYFLAIKLFIAIMMIKHDFHMSLVMRKTFFCICENKDADQLRDNREADQRLCFRYTDSTILLLPKS